jgi:hypothetical protein
MEIEVPSRVIFLNIKDGNAFFDCSPAEARMAIRFVEDMRENGESNLDEAVRFATSIDCCAKAAIGSPVSEKTTVGAFSAHVIADCFCQIERNGGRVSHVFMMAEEYAWLRKFDKDVLDMETKAWKLKAGVFAVMWGAYVVVLPKDRMPKGTVIFSSMDYPDRLRYYRIELTYDPNCKYGLPPEKPKEAFEEKLDRILEMLHLWWPGKMGF